MENPTFHLEGVVREQDSLADFEGPLSLILMLLSKNKIEIRDIKVSEILDQYLAYLARMEELDLEVASEFIQMAAYLLYIKTKMLLAPEPQELTELEQLMSSLEQLKNRGALESVRGVLPELAERAEEGLRLFTRGQEPLPKEAREYGYRHEPAELLGALLAVFSRTDARLPGPPAIEGIAPRRIVYGVRDKSRELIALLEGGRRTLREIYALAGSRSELVASFLSVLELCAMGSIILTDREDGEIDVSFAGGDVDSIIEAIEE